MFSEGSESGHWVRYLSSTVTVIDFYEGYQYFLYVKLFILTYHIFLMQCIYRREKIIPNVRMFYTSSCFSLSREIYLSKENDCSVSLPVFFLFTHTQCFASDTSGHQTCGGYFPTPGTSVRHRPSVLHFNSILTLPSGK